MVIDECGSDGAPQGAVAGAAREVVVLLSGDSHRSRLVAALQRAGYRVSQARHPKAWGAVNRPPVLVTDDTADGARLRTDAVAASPETPCVVLTHDTTPARFQELLASGTSALPAGAAVDDVVFAVGAAARSLACVPAGAARELAGSVERPVLTQREGRWLRALAEGTTVVSLARASGYSEREMYRLLRSLYGRLGAGSRTEALLQAERWGLLAPRTAA